MRERQPPSAGAAEGAAGVLQPISKVPPPSTEIAGHSGSVHRVGPAGDDAGAAAELNTESALPPAGRSPHETQRLGAGNEAAGAVTVLDTKRAVPPPPHIAELIEWQRRRVHAIRAQSQCDRSCDAYVSRYLGYYSGLPQAERLALMKQAARMRQEIEKSRGRSQNEDRAMLAPDATAGGRQMTSGDQTEGAPAACLPIIINTITSRAGWDALRTDAERRMREIARTLPVYERCSVVAGFGDLGLACIVAEAGNDLTAYPHYYHLWKRLGLAPFRGKAMSTFRAADLTKAEWSALGYNPMRRGRMAGDVGAALFFNKARNDYGAVYAERRERTALTHPDWTPAHSDADARRIMLKALVADLWRWWQEAARAADVAVAA